MMLRLRTYMLVAMVLIAVAAPVLPQAKGWEPVRTAVSALRVAAREGDVEVRVAPGYVVVSVSQQTPVKIFTILGQKVSGETLSPGVSRLPLSHGVYIVKVGDLTCKIAV